MRPNDENTPKLLTLLQEPQRSSPRDIFIVYRGCEKGQPDQEFRNVFLNDCTMISYQQSDDAATFVFQYRKHVGTAPPANQTAMLTRPEDWGRIAAAKLLGGSTSAVA